MRQKEAKRILEEIESRLECKIEGDVEIADYEDIKLLFINGKLYGMIYGTTPFLNVEGLKEYKANKKSVVVDDGAIKYILNGADVMAPGVVDADEEIKKDDFVWIRDERGLPLAVGIALMSGKEMKEMNKGRAVKNIHHIGDKIWKLAKSYNV